MAGLRHILSRLPAAQHFSRVTGAHGRPPSRPHQPGAGIFYGGYCPKTCKVIEPLKALLLWAFVQNGGDRCVMSVATMTRLLTARGATASRRTVGYALKRLQLDGFISRQSRWVKLADGVIKRARSITRPKGRLLNEYLRHGRRGLRLLALGFCPGGEGVVQKLALGYQDLLQNVVPKDLSTARQAR